MTILQIGIEWFDKGNKPFPFLNLSIQKKTTNGCRAGAFCSADWLVYRFQSTVTRLMGKSTATIVIEKANPLFAFCLLNRNFALRI